MIYTALANRAMQIAYEAHAGQVDKCGTPYVFHPYHLAEQMPDEVTTCVALLHDVVEDTPITLDELEREFPPEVTESLRLLTHDPAVPYRDYIDALVVDPVARTVKRADLAHNLDETRFEGCGHIDEAELSRRRERYRVALEVLDEGEQFGLMLASLGGGSRYRACTPDPACRGCVRGVPFDARHSASGVDPRSARSRGDMGMTTGFSGPSSLPWRPMAVLGSDA